MIHLPPQILQISWQIWHGSCAVMHVQNSIVIWLPWIHLQQHMIIPLNLNWKSLNLESICVPSHHHLIENSSDNSHCTSQTTTHNSKQVSNLNSCCAEFILALKRRGHFLKILFYSLMMFTINAIPSLIARFMAPTWGPSGANRAQVGPMLAPWTLLSGFAWNWPNTMNIWLALWILMAWCFSTRASVASVLSTHSCVS